MVMPSTRLMLTPSCAGLCLKERIVLSRPGPLLVVERVPTLAGHHQAGVEVELSRAELDGVAFPRVEKCDQRLFLRVGAGADRERLARARVGDRRGRRFPGARHEQ